MSGEKKDQKEKRLSCSDWEIILDRVMRSKDPAMEVYKLKLEGANLDLSDQRLGQLMQALMGKQNRKAALGEINAYHLDKLSKKIHSYEEQLVQEKDVFQDAILNLNERALLAAEIFQKTHDIKKVRKVIDDTSIVDKLVAQELGIEVGDLETLALATFVKERDKSLSSNEIARIIALAQLGIDFETVAQETGDKPIPQPEKLGKAIAKVESLGDEKGRTKKEWKEAEFLRYMDKLAVEGQVLKAETFPQQIDPGAFWWRKIENLRKINFLWHFREKQKVVVGQNKEIKFSVIMGENQELSGFDGRSLVEDDPEGKYALKTLGDIVYQPDHFVDESLGRKPYIYIESFYRFLTDPSNPKFRIIKTNKEVYWVFVSEKTQPIKAGDFKDGSRMFRDRWIKMAGIDKTEVRDQVFSSNGVPWSSEEPEVWKKVAMEICDHYQLILYKQFSDGHLEREF